MFCTVNWIVFFFYCPGYGVVLQLLKEVIDEDALTEDEDEDVFASSDEETVSPLMHKDRIRSLSSNSNLFSNKSLSGRFVRVSYIMFKTTNNLSNLILGNL